TSPAVRRGSCAGQAVLVLHRSRGPQSGREERRVPDRSDRRRHDRSHRDFCAGCLAHSDLRGQVRKSMMVRLSAWMFSLALLAPAFARAEEAAAEAPMPQLDPTYYLSQ